MEGQDRFWAERIICGVHFESPGFCVEFAAGHFLLVFSYEKRTQKNPPGKSRQNPHPLQFSTQTLPTEKNSGGINFGKDYSMSTN